MPLLLLMGLDGFMQLHHAISNRMIFRANLHARREKNCSLLSLKITRFLTAPFFQVAKG
jgi:hypothetical protein